MPKCHLVVFLASPDRVKVCHVAPLVEKDFRVRNLADRLKDLSFLTVLYPNIPKEEAFSEYWSKESTTPDDTGGYIKHSLCMTVLQSNTNNNAQL